MKGLGRAARLSIPCDFDGIYWWSRTMLLLLLENHISQVIQLNDGQQFRVSYTYDIGNSLGFDVCFACILLRYS